MKKKIMLVIFGIVIVILAIIVFLIINRNRSSARTEAEGAISDNQFRYDDAEEDSVSCPEIDEYESRFPDSSTWVTIKDPENWLGVKDFMSIHNHVVIKRALSKYLQESGYSDCKVVTVVNGTASEDGGNGIFAVRLDCNPDRIIWVKAWNKVGGFTFSEANFNSLTAEQQAGTIENTASNSWYVAPPTLEEEQKEAAETGAKMAEQSAQFGDKATVSFN